MAGSFSISLEKFAIKTESAAVVACQKIAMEVWGRVIMKSPVGDPSKWNADFVAAGTTLGWFDKNYVGGRFRANWGCQVGSPYAGTVDTVDKAGGATVAKANMTTAQWNGRVSIFLVNNLPYSLALENGHSKQAPSGMVRITVAEMQNGAAEAAIK
jgi:hypothetical protein